MSDKQEDAFVLQEQERQELRAKVRQGLADIEAGRVRDFDPERIITKAERKS